jgi:hypothetical protein
MRPAAPFLPLLMDFHLFYPSIHAQGISGLAVMHHIIQSEQPLQQVEQKVCRPGETEKSREETRNNF